MDYQMYRIEKPSYKKLQQLKLDLDLKTINDVIKYLLDKNNG